MRLRINEIAEALDVDTSEILSVCAILKIPASSRISSLTVEEAKKITDYYQNI